MPHLTAHLDADCFYVSAERVRDPHLQGKPVGVLGNQGACVIAKSYEMKARGIKTGEPIWEAIQKCPEGIYVKRDFRWYEVISRRMLAIVERYSPCVEYYSIDEFFFRVLPPADGDYQTLARQIRDAILHEVGVPVTIGMARTRTLAKLFSDTAKPFGAVTVETREQERELLAKLAVTEITGIAKRRALRLVPYRIHTCLDLAQADRVRVRNLLTIAGEALWWELNGDPVIPLKPNRPAHKTLSRGGSVGGRVCKADVLWAWVVRNLERLVEELEWHRVKAGKFAIFLSHADAPATIGACPLDTPTDRFETLLAAARIGLRRAWQPGWSVTHMHLIAEDLCTPGNIQGGLFARPDEPLAKLAALRRDVNTRHGRFQLRSAATLPLREVYSDPINNYDICDIRGKMCF
jgi:DNA polymerase V